MQHWVFFEGDSLLVTDLLGEAGIVHITCSECTVKEVTVDSSGSTYAKVVNKNNVYSITGIKEGKTTVTLNVTKDYCKFHQYDNDNNTCNATIYVFKKPKTETSATTLTLYEDLRDSYNYYIIDMDGTLTKGERNSEGKIVFTGLDENTKYEIMVEAPYADPSGQTMYAYAYVYDTTKQLVNAKVNIRLDNTTNVTADTVGLDVSTLKLHSVISGVNYDLNKIGSGSTVYYQARVGAGTYEVYDNGKKIGDGQLIIDAKDAEITLNYYSVKYYANGGTGAPADEMYYLGSIVEASNVVPTKPGYIFTGWKLNDTSTIIQPKGLITYSIQAPVRLTAQWVENTNVYVNVVIKHGQDIAEKDNSVSFSLASKLPSESTYTKVDGKNISLTGTSTDKFDYEYDSTTHVAYYNYKESTPTFENVPANKLYDLIGSEKTNYTITTTVQQPENVGDPVYISLVYTFNPNGHKINFSVELDDNLKNGPDYLKPKSANVKVTTYDALNTPSKWRHIIQHDKIAINVPLDENGKGTGETEIWAFMQGDSEKLPYYFRIEVVSIEYPDGTIVEVNSSDGLQKEKATDYVDENNIYSAKVTVTGNHPQDKSGAVLNDEPVGIYFENDTKDTPQTGIMKAVISAKFYNVTFNANGGKVNGSDTQTVENVLAVPLFRDYIPTKGEGYVFVGWYKDQACTEVATAGEIINSTNFTIGANNTVTLYAKWIDPVRVVGNVNMNYQYTYKGNNFNLLPADRPKSTKVILQKKPQNLADENANWLTVTSQSAVYSQNINITSLTENTAKFAFNNLDAVDAYGNKYEYRIIVDHQNFTTSYHDQKAVFPTGSNTGEANADLTFVPDVFKIGFEVKANDVVKQADYNIGGVGTKNIRPKSVNVVYEFVGEDSGHGWETVVQHQKPDGSDNTVTGTFDNDGITTGGGYTLDAWKYSNITENLTKYQFRLKVDSYVDGNGTTVVPQDESNIPFEIIIDNIETFHDTNSSKNGTLPVSANPDTTPNAILKAHIEPKDFSIFLDTGLPGTTVDSDGYFERGPSDLTYPEADIDTAETGDSVIKHAVEAANGTRYEKSFVYGDVVPNLPVPQAADYQFLGWYEIKITQNSDGTFTSVLDNKPTTRPVPTSGFSSRYYIARWAENTNFTEIVFHDNFAQYLPGELDSSIFRVFSTADGAAYPLTIGQPLYTDSAKNYDLPDYDNNKLIFKGWYYDEDKNNESRPINWTTVSSVAVGSTTNIYAHWIVIDNAIQKEAADPKIISSQYNGFDLCGVQIRKELEDEQSHYGNVSAGLRFVTSMSENVYKAVNALPGDLEYGYVMAKQTSANNNITSSEKLLYKDANSNGVNTNTKYSFVQNIKCNGVVDHYNGQKYRLFTAVISYNNSPAEAKSQNIVARSYIKYTDANNLVNRVHYNDYTGTKVYGGCSTSYNAVEGLIN